MNESSIMTREYALQTLPKLQHACSLRPDSFMMAELASCYFTLGEIEKAVPLCRVAWETCRNPGIAMNFAMMLKDVGQHAESAKVVEHAYWLDSDDYYIRLGYAEALLKNGNWKNAWQIYDNARPTQAGAAFDLGLPHTTLEWDGGPLSPDHKLLVINEGGAGDRMSYARWLPKLTEMGINWVFYPYAPLYPFFERLFGKDKVLKDGDQIVPDPTHWVTTFALPAKLNVGPNEIPPPLPFTATPEAIAKYKIQRTDSLPVVGLCYEASELFQGGRKVRSLTEGQAMRLVCMTGDKVHWVNLQHGKKMPYPVTNLPFDAWEDTAGLIHNLDAVVSVDTSVMHLAGALNKPLAIPLSANSCWKFLLKGSKCIWYPSAVLYRNETYGMEEAINQLVPRIRNGTAWKR
jgi:hypothetical protein